jgi:preprotein translocase subunit YajC
MDWLISTAQAQAGGAAANPLLQMLPLVLIFVVFYFLLIRPQGKRAKEHKAMVAAMGVGDASGVQVKVQRHTITSVLPKGTLKSA